MTKASESKRRLEDIMREFSDTLVEGILVLKDAIFNLSDDRREEFNNKVTEMIEIENKADRLKDELIEKFLKREAMAFSRSDRIQLIENIDMIFDNMEYCARTIQIHSFLIKDYSILASSFKKYTNDLTEIIKIFSTAVNTAEENLEKVIELTREIEKLRQEAKEQIYQMMKDIVMSDYKTLEKLLLYRSTECLLAILEKTEETSDLLRMIAVKYLVLK
jgi:predicted phosphate transport protein (TIGR00153 family)